MTNHIVGGEINAVNPVARDIAAIDEQLAFDSPGYQAGTGEIGVSGLGKAVAAVTEIVAATAILRMLPRKLSFVGGPAVAGCTSDPSPPEPYCTV